MKSIAQESPFGSTIFCDDIRHELGGKVSYIGIYSGSINFNQPLPITLAKFGFAIRYSERPGESTEDVTIGIYFPGDPKDAPSMKIDLPIQEMRSKSPDSKLLEAAQDLVITIIFHFVMENLSLKEEGHIKVRAYRGDLEVRLGTLTVISTLTKDVTPKEAPPTTKKAKPKKAKAKAKAKKPTTRKRARSKKR